MDATALLGLLDAKWFGDVEQPPSRTNSLQTQNENVNLAETRNPSASQVRQKRGINRSHSASDLNSQNSNALRSILPQSMQKNNRLGDTRDPLLEGPNGTWASRQLVLLDRSPPSTLTRAEPSDETIQTNPSADQSDNNDGPVGGLPPPAAAIAFAADESDIHEAWRWRMGRKFMVEQTRINSMNSDDDDWSAALQYLTQVEQGMNQLQAGQLASLERFPSLHSLSLSQSMSLLMEGSLSLKEGSSALQRTTSIDLAATKQITNAMKKAQMLLIQQQEIERQVDAKWEEAMNTKQMQGNQLVEPARLDSWGRFSFIIVKTHHDAAGYTKFAKLLLRGRNGLQNDQIYKALEAELNAAAIRERMPGPRMELIATGEMHWSNDPKCVSIAATKLHSLADCRIQQKSDIPRVAARIVESCLPVKCQISLIV